MTVLATIAQKNICHVSVCDHEDATSSSANSSPPVGAPKAEATPAPAPAVIRSRSSFSLRHLPSFSGRHLASRTSEMMRPHVAPIEIIGPSGPTGSPAPLASAHEANLTTSVCTSKMCRWKVPVPARQQR